MLIPVSRTAKVGKYMFVNVAIMKDRAINGYDSEKWAIPGGDIWDEHQLKQFALDNNLFIEYGAAR